LRAGKKAPLRNAQGIEAVSFFAMGKKDTSVKPGPRTRGARMRPELRIFQKLNISPSPVGFGEASFFLFFFLLD
jgi:hypothetical protein